MKKPVSWIEKMEDGIKREVRITFVGRAFKWQFKRADQERWDYDSEPTGEEWERLEEILARRAGRGRCVRELEAARKIRGESGE